MCIRSLHREVVTRDEKITVEVCLVCHTHTICVICVVACGPTAWREHRMCALWACAAEMICVMTLPVSFVLWLWCLIHMPPNTGDHRITSSTISASTGKREPTCHHNRVATRCVTHQSAHAWSHTQSVCAPHRVSIGLVNHSECCFLVSSSERADVSLVSPESDRNNLRTEQRSHLFSSHLSTPHHTTHHQNTNTPWCVVLAGVGVCGVFHEQQC